MSVLLRKALEAGDQVIGHTPGTRKPIFANKGADHPAYAGYSSGDHIVAANLHANRAKELNIAAARTGGSMTLKRQAAQSIHFATTHRQAGTGQSSKLAASRAAKGQNMQAIEMYWEALAKAAGDRGGNVLGRTRSGKIIYGHKISTHASYKGMSAADHKQAASFHEKAAAKFQKEARITSGSSSKQRSRAVERMNHHSAAADGHRRIAESFKT